MLIDINEEQDKKVEEFLKIGIANFKTNFIYEKKILGKKQENEKNKDLRFNQKNRMIYNYSNINNKKKDLIYEYITYNGQSAELINNTIHALNTGLKYFPKTSIKKNKSINIKSKDNNEKLFFTAKKTQKKLRTKKEKLANKVIKKNINLKKFLNNKEEAKIKNINDKLINKSFNYNKRQIKNLSTEGNNEINFSSLIQKNSTFEDRKKNYEIDKEQYIHSINMKDNEKFQNNNFEYIRNNKIVNLDSKTQIINNENSKKYEKIKLECQNTKKKINNIKHKNNNIEYRINEMNNKFNNFNKIEVQNDNNKINFECLENIYKNKEDVKIKQRKLIQKLYNEIEVLKNVCSNY